METSRQGVRCAKAGEIDYTKMGRSRVGGDPDLPPQFAWPLTTDGTPMTFLVQLNMCDLAKNDANALLPKTGMLSFFSESMSQLTILNIELYGLMKQRYYLLSVVNRQVRLRWKLLMLAMN